MSEEIIQMFWECRHCGNIGPGLTGEDEGLRCGNCGNQKANEPWIMPDDIQNAPAITDAKLLKRARAGENWTCGSCRHEERALHNTCSVCGAPRPSEVAQEPAPPRSQIEFEEIGAKPKFNDSSTVAVGETHSRPTPIGVEAEWPPRDQRRKSMATRFLIGMGIAASLFGLVCLLVWLFGTHEDVARVTAMSWERKEVLEERHIKHGEDWRSDMPSDAFDESCENKLKGHRNCNPYKCNPHPVPYECSCSGGTSYPCNCQRVCTSNNNGSATCSQQCSTCTTPRVCQTCTRTEYDTCYEKCPIYEDYCAYKYPQWDAIKKDERSGGGDMTPEWPGLTAQGQDQRVQRSGTYHVSFQSTSEADRKWGPLPTSEAEYAEFEVGQCRHVDWSHAGTFEVKGVAQTP